jgi:hypothetical protein
MDMKQWAAKYNYRNAGAVDSCDLCSYANHIDADNDKRVEALTCAACSEDTGVRFQVNFESICDLYLPELLEEVPDDQQST